MLRLLEGLGGEGWLERLLLRLLASLLELEGGVGLLKLGLLRLEGWLGSWLLGGEKLGVRGVSRVDEGVHSLTVGTGWH